MKKQIIYPKFISRIFATSLDLFFLSILLMPIMNLLSKYVTLYIFNQFFIDYGIDTSSNEAIIAATRMPEFADYISGASFITRAAILCAINFLFMAIYFIGFWIKLGTTPGKIFLKMKIVDAEDYDVHPSPSRFIKRFLGYSIAIIGLWSILFSKKGQALHDKIADTVVIKS
jgi:uncharacterized RDD family membrane protein YckC